MDSNPRGRRRPLIVALVIIVLVMMLAGVILAPILAATASAQAPSPAPEAPVLDDLPAGDLPPEHPAAAPANLPAAWPIGAEVYQHVLHWAGQRANQWSSSHPQCGLTRDRLAAAMISIIYYEAGYTLTRAPSPMTLGRWDTLSVRPDNARLYAFATPSTPYQKAYFHAGIGMWQFDSAGHYPLTAAGAIDSWTAAEEASKIIAQRYCSNPSADPVEKMRTGWAPWVACWPSRGDRCFITFDDIFDGTSLQESKIALKQDVTRYGGMEVRSCRLSNTPVTCHYVDPSKAQGNKDWADPTYGQHLVPPTAPISAPFYVIERNGREHRFWLAEDTGYGVTITADKPVTAHARTEALVWSFSDALCDETAQRGSCGNPFGNFDQVVAGPGSVTVRGWAIDPDTPQPIHVHVYVKGRFSGQWTADASRPDVAAAIPGYGPNHGFHATINGVAQGLNEVCVYAINVGQGSGNPHLGCKTVNVQPGPAGFWDVPPGRPFLEEISWSAEVGIATGFENGTFRPSNAVTRQAMAAFLKRLHELVDGAPVGGAGGFADVSPNHPFKNEIGWLASSGIAEGFPGGLFQPDGVVTRQAMAAFLMRLHELVGGSPVAGGEMFVDVPDGHPFVGAIGWLASTGITTGFEDGSFRPREPVTRQAMAAFLHRFAQLLDTGA